MRIVHINSAKNWAGGEVHTHLVCKELVARGYDVTLACRQGSAISEVFEKDGLTTVVLPLRNAIDVLSAYRLAKYCRENRISILHAHLGRDYWLAAWTKFFYPEVYVVFTRHVLIPLKNSLIHRWVFAQASTIIAVSHAVEQMVTKSGLVADDKIVTIHNGIDIDKFSQASPGNVRCELHTPAETKLIGIIGHVSEHKGQDVLIKSMPSIIEKDPSVRCVIVGGDFKDGVYVQELKALAKSLGVDEKVHFLGQRSDIPHLMKDLDVFVLASQEEPFGLVLVEAMAAGVPVIATNRGGPGEIIEEEISGLLVPYGDIDQHSRMILKILSNQALADRLIKQAHQRGRSFFSVDIMMERLIRVYESLMDHIGPEETSDGQ